MRSFTADNGTVHIPVHPKRIVTVGSANLFLEMGVKPVGMTPVTGSSNLAWLSAEEKANQDAAADIGAYPNISYEKIAALKPDLIVVNVPDFAWKKSYNRDRLASIAPTVYIEIDNTKWKTQGARVADAVDEHGAFNEDKAAYDRLTAEIKTKYRSLLGSTTFAVVDRYTTTDEGSFNREYGAWYCSGYAGDAGLNIVGGQTAKGTKIDNETVSMERLGDLAKVDAILYPLTPDGKTKREFETVVESNAWKSLPEVSAGRALGVKCATTLTYPSKITSLESLEQGLSKLAGK
ncbi:iron-hydroxamate ABC transporter substrate-binding protein [Amycolatopsis ultiminotia]|uniref:Iron-hydroxamate ABC transporter substrate-binding protein n=2 Tax=Amycolatopsis ultiminotia TaxID=543629 RepID=A0ABP6UTT4_9PSEU